ncbi:dTMP kinase [Ferroacidibacillus organovorans]|uniref:dTMP kinase n=1 Tax=Ferroacidibacillus organovorans TaxID=1765683 RepID=UPI0015C42A70|nr:dTMP kinase [Ferroacidibacillus organovorans]
MTGLWITVEGIGGSGKSTQVRKLFKWAQSAGIDAVCTREPGGTKAGEQLRSLLKSVWTPKLDPLTEVLLFEADRRETYTKIIRPITGQGHLAISDRGIDGTIAYQGFGKSVDVGLIHQLTRLVTEETVPDLTFLIDIDPTVARQRITSRTQDEIDQFDREAIDFQELVRQGFLHEARLNPGRVTVIDGSNDPNEIHNLIVHIVEERLGR